MNIKQKLNNFYNKVIDDFNYNQVTDYTIEIANKYNQIIKDNPKFQSRMYFDITKLSNNFETVKY